MLVPKPPRPYLHTIHKKVSNIPYVLNILQKDDSYKTTLLSFTEKKDAMMVANVIEQYKIETGEYPPRVFTYQRPFELELQSSSSIQYTRTLEDFYVQETEEKEIYEYCAKNLFDLMILGNLEKEGTIKIYAFNVSTDYMRELLEKRFI